MRGLGVRTAAAVLVFVIGASALPGCRLLNGPERPVPLPPNVAANDLLDADDPAESLDPLDPEALAQVAKQIRESRKPKTPPEKKYEILVLSGGAVYGAYSAGVLVGWSDAGDRPIFDVITGVSIGALTAPFVFAGPEYDSVIRESSTMLRSEDLFKRRRGIRELLNESVADNTPLRKRLNGLITPQFLQKVAAEHAKGRRLYIGSTNLDTKRLVVWDLGAIATKGDVALFIDTMLASAAIPGFFPSVRFNVEIDGQQYEELHVDGGVTRSMFFRVPYIPPDKREAFGPSSLYDSNMYILIAGKLFADSDGVSPRTLRVAGAAISSLLYSGTRGDLARLYNYCTLTGMNYRSAAIPQELEVPMQSTNFDPAQTTKMFEAGYRAALEKKVWRTTPPGLVPGEGPRTRTGLRLKVQPATAPAQPTNGGDEKLPIPPVVPKK